jgi:hypothetical protein
VIRFLTLPFVEAENIRNIAYYGKTVTIIRATEKYEAWLGGQMPLVETDIAFKHQQMASTAFPFFRATYYRWAQKWEKVCDKAAEAPSVLAVGDLHVENFGTWRDLEGRLIWGVNDFDEAIELPYTNDLIRLAAGAELAIREERLRFDLPEACEAILEGYSKSLEVKGRPFVLEEHHQELRSMATSSLRSPDQFWSKMKEMGAASGPALEGAVSAIEDLISPDCDSQSMRSRRAGLGSLGRPRYVLLAELEGGLIAREAKHTAGSAVCWANKEEGPYVVQYETILDQSVRCKDPLVRLCGDWLVRRLAPHCTRIPLDDWPKEREEIDLVRAMGFETANIHLGTDRADKLIRADLKDRPKKWLRKAAEAMADAVEEDAEAWREHFKRHRGEA